MPGKDRSEPFVLKHRLTGAAILIAFAVIVLPLLLGGPDSGDDQGAGAGNDMDTTIFHSNITPIGGATPTAQQRNLAADARQGADSSAPAVKSEDGMQTAAVDSDADSLSGSSDAGSKDASGSGADSRPEAQSTAKAGESKDKAKTRTVERGWIVQVGVFKNPDNVKKLVAKLADGGIESSTTDIKTSEGDATRVYVGPFETRVEAARTKVRVKQRTGSEGLIVAYP
jgi:DedD protein